MDFEDVQQRLTRAMAINAEAALLAIHQVPRNDTVCHLCLLVQEELQEAMRIVTQAIECQAHAVETT